LSTTGATYSSTNAANLSPCKIFAQLDNHMSPLRGFAIGPLTLGGTRSFAAFATLWLPRVKLAVPFCIGAFCLVASLPRSLPPFSYFYPMSSNEYKQWLEDAVRTLQNAENDIFTAMVNVGFSGVYKDISRVHEPGDVINMELAMFEDTDDQNLDLLVEAVKSVAAIKQRLMNLNGIELDEELDEDEDDDREFEGL